MQLYTAPYCHHILISRDETLSFSNIIKRVSNFRHGTYHHAIGLFLVIVEAFAGLPSQLSLGNQLVQQRARCEQLYVRVVLVPAWKQGVTSSKPGTSTFLGVRRQDLCVTRPWR